MNDRQIANPPVVITGLGRTTSFRGGQVFPTSDRCNSVPFHKLLAAATYPR